MNLVEGEVKRLKETVAAPTKQVTNFLDKYSSTNIKSGITLFELMKRPELNYIKLVEIDKNRPVLPGYIKESVEVRIKYEGYIQRQKDDVIRFKKKEQRAIPKNIEYTKIKGLRIEAMQKLDKFKPKSLGQASRISGVSPADIDVLMIYMEAQKRKGSNEL